MTQERMLSLEDLAKVYSDLDTKEVVLDVRNPDEYAEGHIPGSINIPHDQIADHAEDLKVYDKIYIHCKMGGRAKKAFDTLHALGLENIFCISDAGMQAWKEKNYPTVSEQ